MQAQQQSHQHQRQHQHSHKQADNSHDQQSTHNHLSLSGLKQQVSLTNHQLLQLTYNDQKFLLKLKQLNHHGCQLIKRMQFTEALVYLTEAEKVLEYAASCGKTIQRKLIITTLNNQAALYQKAWQLEKAQSYLEAIIYNIASSFDNNSEEKLHSFSQTNQKELTPNILDKNSTQYLHYSTNLWKKKNLAIFYLQYCAINSQNKNNQQAFSSAQKALRLIKQVCMDLHRYEKYIQQITPHNYQPSNQIYQHSRISSDQQSILYQLGSFQQIQITPSVNIDPYYKAAVRQIAIYMKRLQTNTSGQTQQQTMQKYRKCFQNYSIGTIMQITPYELDERVDKLDLSEQITTMQKHFQAIYLSVGHFILGTESRFIAAEKYSLDQNQRRESVEFHQSQIYHLCSIIILTKYLLCESGYFDHIVNSFRNHYRVDILDDARKYLQSHAQIQSQEDQQQHEYIQLFHKEQNSQQNTLRSFQQDFESKRIQEIKRVVSEVQIVYLTPGKLHDDNNVKGELYLNNQESLEYGRDKHAGAKSKTIKISENAIYSHTNGKQQRHHEHQGPAIKKIQHKKTTNLITKNSPTIQIHQNPKYVFMATQQPKQSQKAIYVMTSREKEIKQKPTQLNSNTNRSKSKRKSDCLFLSNTKKMYTSKQKASDNNIKQRVSSKKQTIYSKRQTDHTPKKTSRSKSKNKRLATESDIDKKGLKRKDSYLELRKTKRVQEQYGSVNHGSKKHSDGIKGQAKTSRSNICGNSNINAYIKKSKSKRQREQNMVKFKSPDLKFKKLKSPRNNKK